VKRLVDILLADMSSSFEPLSPATFLFERLETNPRFATITRPANAALLVRLRVDVEERSGIVEILLPHATLEPIRDLLLQMFMGEKFGQDTVWEKHLGKELRHTEVNIEAILNEKEITLGDVMRFKVGSTILLDCMPEDEVVLKCSGVPITKGKLGRVGENMAIAISEPVAHRHKEA
jgi:flagellar motor switch protein FliM